MKPASPSSGSLFDTDQFRMRRLQVFNWGTFSELHDIAVAEIRLDGARVHATVGKVEAGCVAQHVWMDGQLKGGPLSGPGHHLAHRCLSDRPAALRDEEERRLGVGAFELT